MDFKKIIGPTRFDAGVGGADVEYTLPPRSGGRSVKSVSHMVKIIGGTTNAKVGFKLKHGPDGSVSTTHTSTASATITTPPSCMAFDGGSAAVSEHIHPVVLVGGTAATDFVVIEVFEMRKPF